MPKSHAHGKTVIHHLFRVSYRLFWLAVIGAGLSVAPAVWAANLTSVTFPTPVYVGNPFTVTITSTSNDQVGLTFSIPGSACTVNPPTATYVAGQTTQTFTVTINCSTGHGRGI